MTSSWQRKHLQLLDGGRGQSTVVFSALESSRIFPELYIWDPWPVRLPTGEAAFIGDTELWMGLSAPSDIEPQQRHDVACLRLLSRRRYQWRDHGPLFAEAVSPGAREWSGCATYLPDKARLDVWYTAAGIRNEKNTSYIQRIFQTSGALSFDRGEIRLREWRRHRELIGPVPHYRSTLNQLTGEVGFIKAFRDPSRFVDPVDKRTYMVFSASLADSSTDFDGAIGAAAGADADDMALLPPLLHADGVNNELERPHVVWRDGLYYLFFSTQASTFHPAVSGPTGLYGFVAESMSGKWTPLNGSGLVFRNPDEEPFQAYSWLVMQNLDVVGFVNFADLKGESPREVEARGEGRHKFVGTITPKEQIVLEGDQAQLLARER